MSTSGDFITRQARMFSEQHIHICNCRGVGWVRVDAPVGHVLFGKAIPCVCQRDEWAAERARNLRRLSGLSDQELAQWSLDRFDPARCRPGLYPREETVRLMRDIKRQCEAYAAHPRGWLVLQGPTGAGKTHLAYGIAISGLRRGVPVYPANTADMLDSLRGTFTLGNYDQVMGAIREVEILVLDDVGAHRMTDWAVDVLYQLINYRYQRNLSLVVTTNADLEHWEIDPRIRSRLLHGAEQAGGRSRVLTLPVEDYRLRRAA
jgi:DNA replication protein DnaC